MKLALGLSSKRASSQDGDSLPPSERPSEASLLSPPGDWTSAPPTPSGSNKLRLSKSLSRSSSTSKVVYLFPLLNFLSLLLLF